MSGSRIGLFGGSFDPIHRGHVEPVLEAARALALDRVLYLPTARPPHKQGPRYASALSRLAMVELALLDHDHLLVDPLELGEQVHYTIDTVRTLQEREPGVYFLFLGADSLLEFDQWRAWRDIAAACELVVLRRPGFPLEPDRWPEALREGLDPTRVHVIDNHLWQASSTTLRGVLGAGRTSADSVARDARTAWANDDVASEMLHPRVLQYVEKYGLYG